MKGDVALTALLLMGAAACATSSPSPAPVTPSLPFAPPEDSPEIRSLPGYRTEMVDAPGFTGQAYVMEAGPADAPTVVLVHGIGDNGSTDFHPILPVLAARYHILTFDLPGFGRSTHAYDLYAPEKYVAFVHALLAQRVRAPVNLVGHSMGGAIALAYAAAFPADVERLFLMDAAGILHRKAYVNFALSAGLDNVLGVLAESGKAVANDAMERSSQAAQPWLPASPDPSLLLDSDLLRVKVLQTPTRIAALATIMHDFGPALAKVTAPTWILWGSKDGVASLRAGKILKERLPYAQLRVLDGAGHDPMSQRPAAVVDFLLQGLATPPRPPWKRVRVAPILPDRPAHCEGQSGVRVTGDYSEITLDGCEATLIDVKARKIHIRNSRVVLENTVVFSPDIAVDTKDSRVEMTACELSGSTALSVDGGELDLAGVDLHGDDVSVKVSRGARLIFSVSRVDSAIQRRFVHEMVDAPAGEEW